MHDYCRKPDDIVRVVKIHESTLRKRLLEFGETPSSSLTLDEFMTIDLEAEQDPPAFKAARKKDKERLSKITDESELTALQIEIDAALERDFQTNTRKRKITVPGGSVDIYDESTETDKFIKESTFNVISECLNDDDQTDESQVKVEALGLKPDLVALCTVSEKEQNQITANENAAEEIKDLDLEGLDDDEINGYILSETEALHKDRLWKQMNAEYLQQVKEREERNAKEREDGKPEKKKRRGKKKPIGPSSSAGAAIEKMLHEKKISTKINYDILKSLTTPIEKESEEIPQEIDLEDKTESVLLTPKFETSPRKMFINLSKNRRSKGQVGLPVASTSDVKETKSSTTIEPDEAENQGKNRKFLKTHFECLMKIFLNIFMLILLPFSIILIIRRRR